MYRTWFAIGVAGLLGGVAVVSLFVGFGSPVFLGVAAVSAVGAFLAYRYARERMLRSVYAGVETGHRGTPAADGDGADPTAGARGGSGDDPGRAGGSRQGDGGDSAARGDRGGAAQATDGGSTTADYDDWTWTDSDPDDPFWSDDPEDWEDPWEWEATDPEDAGADGWRRRRGSGDDPGSDRWSGWSGRTGGTDDGSTGGRDDDRAGPGDGERRPTVEEAYETLGLDPGADADAVREAYRERAKETHPDLGGDPEAFIRVREAYERLRERLDGEG